MDTEQLIRKQLLRRKPSGKFIMQDFQMEDLTTLVERDASANWSEMGCMKTTTAEWLWDMQTRNIPNPRVLVITTRSGKGTYFESIPEVLLGWDVYNVSTTRFSPVVGGKIVPVDCELPDPLYMNPVVVVAHYHCFTDRAVMPRQVMGDNGLPLVNENGTFEMEIPRCNILLRMHWDMIVVDEAHRIKNVDTQWTRNIKKLKATKKHIMTGTGFINNPAEIWSLLNFLYPDVYTSYWRFREHYCEEDDYSGYRKIVGIKPARSEEFRDLVRRVGVRRSMAEVFTHISEPIESVVTCKLNPTQRKMYEELRDELMTLDAAGEPLHSPNVLSLLNRLRQICVATPKVIEDYYDWKQERRIVKVQLIEPSSKLDECMELIQSLEWDEERKDQVVVFSNFKDPLDLLKTRLAAANIPYLHLRAEMGDQQRYELWHDIWTKKEHQVFLCTLQVGSESINLSSANRAIFLDQSWSPKDNSQARGRIYRPGQTGVAQFIYIRAENTVDFRVLEKNTEKMGWFKEVFGAAEEKELDSDDDD